MESPTVLVSGCKELDEGKCVLGHSSAELYIWVDVHAEFRLELRVDGIVVPLEGPGGLERQEVEGGLRLKLSVPASAMKLELNGIDLKWRKPWRLQVLRREDPSWLLEFLEQWSEERTRERRETMVARLESRTTSARGWDRLRGLDILRRCKYILGDRERASELAQQTISLARKLQASKAELKALAAQAHYQLLRLSKPQKAKVHIDRLYELGQRDPSASIRAHYSSALVDRSRGNLMGSLWHLRKARRLADRLGEFLVLADAIELEAMTLGELGRSGEASALARRVFTLFERTEIPCERKVQIARNFGWTQLVLGSLELAHQTPQTYFLEVLELLNQCPNDWERANSIVNLALAAIQDKQPEQALEWLAQLDVVVPLNLQHWVEEVRTQAALDLGRPELAASLVQNPMQSDDRQFRWRSIVQHARLSQRYGFLEVAEEGYRRAEDLLDHILNSAGLGSKAELYLAGRSASIRGLVEILLDSGQIKEALCAARLARSRGLLVLDRVTRLAVSGEEELDRWNEAMSEVRSTRQNLSRIHADLWKLPVAESRRQRLKVDNQIATSDEIFDQAMHAIGVRSAAKYCHELRTPNSDEVILYMFPMLEDWAVFFGTNQGWSVLKVADSELFSSQARWLRSIDGLGDAQKIVVVPSGASWMIRVHALPWREGMILDQASVRYSLDLPPRSEVHDEQAILQGPFNPKKVLVVADPSNNLPWALLEAEYIHRTLSKNGSGVDMIAGKHASRENALDRIGHVDLFHYAGHGAYRGTTGWNSELIMHGGASIGVRDVLALPSAPSGVVLTGCETGTANLETLQGGMNLSRAFLLAGTSWVIASDQKIDDKSAYRFATLFYDSLRNTNSSTAAIRSAQLAMRSDKSSKFSISWKNLRMLSP